MDILSLDLKLLVVLDAMLTEGRTTRVAERLGVSQPNVSYVLAKLRHTFGDALFVRDGNAMRPTPFAESLREPVSSVIRTINSQILRTQDFDPAVTERRFTFCMSDIGELVFLPAILAALRREAPKAAVRCVSLSPREIEAGLADGSVDAALGYFPDLSGPAVYQQALFRHPFAVLARKGHPLLEAGLTVERFLSADHAVVAQEGRSQEIFERRMTEMGLTRRVVIQSPHFTSLPFIIANSDIVTTVPLAVAKAFARTGGLDWAPPPFEIPEINLKQFWHRRMHSDRSLVWIRSLIARLFMGRDPSMAGSDPIFGTHPT